MVPWVHFWPEDYGPTILRNLRAHVYCFYPSLVPLVKTRSFQPAHSQELPSGGRIEAYASETMIEGKRAFRINVEMKED